VSAQAFRLLRPLLAPPAAFAPLVEKYAPDFLWPTAPTPQVIAGLPIFHAFRYPELPNYDSGVPVEHDQAPAVQFTLVGSAELFAPGVAGRTPLELYNHLLLENPPLSDQMNRSIWAVLKGHCAAAKAVREAGPGNDPVAFQRRLCEMDSVFYRFFMAPFQTKRPLPIEVMHGHGREAKEQRESLVVRNMAQMLSELLPLDATNPIGRNIDGHFCPSVNGMVRKLISLLRKDIFQDSDGINWAPDVIPRIDDDVWEHFYATKKLMKLFKADAMATEGDALSKMLGADGPVLLYEPDEQEDKV
jgi:hypothetical protein